MTDVELVQLLGTTRLRQGWLEQQVRDQAGMSLAQAWQRVLQAIDDPAVEAAEPAIVHRLRRVRDQHRTARTA